MDPRIPVNQDIVMPVIEQEFEKLRAENERLKAAFDNLNHYATDELERLRAALEKIAAASDWHPDDVQAFARAALGR